MLTIEENTTDALERSLLSLARMCKLCSDEAQALEERIKSILDKECPALIDIYCCGPISAAELAVAAGENPSRLKNEASFAMLCGAAPIPAESGKTNGRVRLNFGGNRRANKALHTIVISRMRSDPKTRAYVDKRRSEKHPLSTKGIIRCLKRYVCREVYRALTHPKDTAARIDRAALREARKKAGLTQAELGHILGVSKSTISDVETGRNSCLRVVELYNSWALEGAPVEVKKCMVGA